MMIVLRASCGLTIPEGLTLPIKKCHICGRQHADTDFERIEIDKSDATIPKSPVIALHSNLNKWPTWAKTLRRLRKAEDKGVGDTVQRIAAWFGGERFKTFSSKIGMPCGCSERQDNWNTQYPYEPEN